MNINKQKDYPKSSKTRRKVYKIIKRI